ncbi:MAG: sodium:proton antiporter [Planctomycetes bacterium]|nr:sodium:proton antiporter [Planctomycetota bacterium]
MFGLAGLLLLGVATQWLAWRLRIPSILLLLVVGFLIGPLSVVFFGVKLLDPDALLGDSLLPFVSLSVAVILFEGGLSLRISDLRGAGRAVFQLILLGPPVTFALATWAAHLCLGLEWDMCMLLGAIMVVTGPTVLLPLLRHVRPAGSLGRIVLWEGIVTDPIGAIVAVVIFQTIVLPGKTESIALQGAGMALLGGGLAGLAGAWLIVILLRRDQIPDYLQAATVLGVALASYVCADLVQHEAGLLAVTLMGILLANQRQVSIEHIVAFKENLRTLLLSMLFLLLAARLPLEEFTHFDLGGFAFLALLLFLVRPASVFLATLGTTLDYRERLFIAWMAPRGVVAAAVASIFALELTAQGRPGAARLVPVIFLVILGTVAVYGLSSLPLARWLKLARPAPQGMLLLGAHEWARRIALALKDAGVEVMLVDTSRHEIHAARMQGLDAHYGNALSDDLLHAQPMENLGQMLALTTNDHANALACLHLVPTFGRASVYQLAPAQDEGDKAELPRHLRGRVLFSRAVSFWTLERRFREGAIVKSSRITKEYGYEDFRSRYERLDAPVIPMFVQQAGGKVRVVNARDELELSPGDTLLALVDPVEDAKPA